MPCVIAKMHWIRTSRRVNLLQLMEARNTQHITASRSKFFFSRSSVQKFSSSVYPLGDLIRSTASIQKFSSSVHPLDLIHSKIFVIRSPIRPFHCEWLGYSFLIHSLAMRSHALHSFVSNVFVWEVTFDNVESGKINYCFGKSLDFWVQKSVRTLRVVSASNPCKTGDKLPFWPKRVERA